MNRVLLLDDPSRRVATITWRVEDMFHPVTQTVDILGVGRGVLGRGGITLDPLALTLRHDDNIWISPDVTFGEIVVVWLKRANALVARRYAAFFPKATFEKRKALVQAPHIDYEALVVNEAAVLRSGQLVATIRCAALKPAKPPFSFLQFEFSVQELPEESTR